MTANLGLLCKRVLIREFVGQEKQGSGSCLKQLIPQSQGIEGDDLIWVIGF